MKCSTIKWKLRLSLSHFILISLIRKWDFQIMSFKAPCSLLCFREEWKHILPTGLSEIGNFVSV